MSEEELKDFIEKRLHSHTFALDGVVGGMKRDWIKFESTIQDIISQNIKVTVNGKIDRLHKEMTESNNTQNETLLKLNQNIDALRVEVAPLIESKNTLYSLRKFLVWIAAPVAIIWSVCEYLTRRL